MDLSSPSYILDLLNYLYGTFLDLAAITISTAAALFTIYKWREGNRPVVTARIGVAGGGNVATALNLVIENTGNRPARNVKFSTKTETIRSMLAPQRNGAIPEEIGNVFSQTYLLTLLLNGQSARTAFGLISRDAQSTWIPNFQLPITITYQSLGWRKFKERLILRPYYEDGFAGGSWGN
jgi:hypothetical protein